MDPGKMKLIPGDMIMVQNVWTGPPFQSRLHGEQIVPAQPGGGARSGPVGLIIAVHDMVIQSPPNTFIESVCCVLLPIGLGFCWGDDVIQVIITGAGEP
jgi:hypothetical protein